MILPTDIPTRAEIDRLLEHRAPATVSIYLPADPASSGEPERIELKTLAAQASSQVDDAGAGVRVVRALDDEIAYLHDDEEFWRYQARSLAVFATPQSLITFRLPNRLLSQVVVSDRFYRRLQGSEGQKVRIHQYARQVDRALRPFLNGLEVPLILAAAEPIDSIYRSVNTYPHLLAQGISGNPETASDAELAAGSRTILDDLYAAQLLAVQELYQQRSAEGRALADVAEVARAATFGAVDTLLVDIDAAVPGTVDDQTGAVRFAREATGDVHDVTDEITRRAWLSRAQVLAVRDRDVPGGGAVAAILRYAL